MVEVFIQDTTSISGAGLTGLTSASTNLTAYYYLNDAASSTVITLASMTLGTFTSSGFIVVDETNMPGVYSLGIPNAALTGADSVTIYLFEKTTAALNMAPVVLEIQLTDFDPNDGVRGGLTSLPNAAADAAGGLATSAGGATGIDDLATPTNITAGTITTVTNLTNAPTNGDLTATMKTSVTTAATAATPIAASVTGAVGSVTTKTGYELAATGADLILSSSTFAAAMADAILLRNASNVETTAGEHTLCTVILAMMEHSISGTTLTIKRTDGVTTHATKTLTVNAAADPITGIT